MMHSMENTITATKAKAELLGLIDRVASGASGPVTITKHGKAKVMIVPIGEQVEPLSYETFFGCMAGSVTIPDGMDLTEPVWGDDWIEVRDGPKNQWLATS
jgi:prevent-host-death family protein